jgi:hypothetical protein
VAVVWSRQPLPRSIQIKNKWNSTSIPPTPSWRAQDKVRITLEQAIKALHLGLRFGWVINATPLQLYPLQSAEVQIVQKAGWAPGRYGWVPKILPPTGLDFRTFQPVASRYTG